MPAATAEPAKYRITPLGNTHRRTDFSSGVEALDRYLHAQAGQDTRKRVATCFVLSERDASEVLGYYTLSATTIALAELPSALAKKLPRYPTIPATLMERLAVDARRRGERLGELLLFDAFVRTLRSEIGTFAFVVDAKDASAQAFYERYDFRLMPSIGRRLYLPMTEIAKLFER